MRPRRQPDAGALSVIESEKTVLNVIKSSQGMGIWIRDAKYRANLPDRTFANALRKLLSNNLVKEVVNVRNRTKKHYMAVEFEPSKEITGGTWYVDGSLDTETIGILRCACCEVLERVKVGTVEMIHEGVRRAGEMKADLGVEEIEQVVRALVLDNEVVQVKSSGFGEYACVPAGRVCYKRKTKKATRGALALASAPCGVCPQISVCTPHGIISPLTCSYFTKWLDF